MFIVLFIMNLFECDRQDFHLQQPATHIHTLKIGVLFYIYSFNYLILNHILILLLLRIGLPIEVCEVNATMVSFRLGTEVYLPGQPKLVSTAVGFTEYVYILLYFIFFYSKFIYIL